MKNFRPKSTAPNPELIISAPALCVLFGLDDEAKLVPCLMAGLPFFADGPEDQPAFDIAEVAEWIEALANQVDDDGHANFEHVGQTFAYKSK